MLEVQGPGEVPWALAGSDAYTVSLMRAIRCADSAHSALNAGVPTDPHSPESNSFILGPDLIN